MRKGVKGMFKYNEEQLVALVAFEKGNNLLILGAGGTGKSEVVREIKRRCEEKGKRVKVTASTGVAANLVDGCTIHSLLRTFSGREKEPINYMYKTEQIANTDVLIIDEISMLNDIMITYVANCLKHVDHEIQVILVGDFKQLKPVEGGFAFESQEWEWFRFEIVELTKVVRQNNNLLIENLNSVSNGDCNSRWFFLENETKALLDAIYLCNTNEEAKRINDEALASLHGSARFYSALTNGDVAYGKIQPEEILAIKRGMRIMTLINDPKRRFQNGSMGTVEDMKEDYVRVRLDNSIVVDLYKFRFWVESKSNIAQNVCVEQIPIRPAYAITIDKSQGQTFDKANIYSGDCWRHGQLYTALSRVRTIEGIHLMNGIWPRNYVVDEKVREFYTRIA